MHDLDQVRAGVLQAALVKLRPPNATLTIDLSIIPCTRPKMRKRVGSKCNLQTYLVQPKCRSSSDALKIGFLKLPVMITSVRLVPNMKLMYLPPGASLPWPYDGNGSDSGQSLMSYKHLTKCISKKTSGHSPLFAFKKHDYIYRS